ncbi:MAG TPA: metal-sulfur cluster assembly factor [Gemmatimonadaceae bacterium]
MPDDFTTPPPPPAPAQAARAADPSPSSAPPDATIPAITEDVAKSALRRVKDPELNLNIVDLGLVYGVHVDGGVVTVDITLTSPGCPSGPEIITAADEQLRTLPGVEDVVMNLVWDPLWTPEKMEPRIRAYMGF